MHKIIYIINFIISYVLLNDYHTKGDLYSCEAHQLLLHESVVDNFENYYCC